MTDIKVNIVVTKDNVSNGPSAVSSVITVDTTSEDTAAVAPTTGTMTMGLWLWTRSILFTLSCSFYHLIYHLDPIMFTLYHLICHLDPIMLCRSEWCQEYHSSLELQGGSR